MTIPRCNKVPILKAAGHTRSLPFGQLVTIVEIPTFLLAGENHTIPPFVVADLESIRQAVQFVHFLGGQIEPVQVKVTLDSRFADGLGNDRSPPLQTPDEEDEEEAEGDGESMRLEVRRALELVRVIDSAVAEKILKRSQGRHGRQSRFNADA
ncbi:hypothetical protein QFC20_004438 [Naganishia adeliensis]|uniref:Uncharacterized protein n=1 Tax=Naganishia adeliensis TaxID=92952 RepID=A0ACC2W1N5_9TREE|nr:hypothetical protein QFC20_004438 [Naganishia adeliensis]